MIAYYRVSTQKQGRSGLGLDSQREIVRQFHGAEIVKEYTEVGSGSTVAGRPVLRQAMAEAKRLAVPLVVAKVDRLARNTREALDLYEQLGGELVCCDVPNADKFTLTLFFAFAERERELVRIRTRLAMRRKLARDGEWRVSKLNDEHRRKGAEARRQMAKANPSNRRARAFVAELMRSGKCDTYQCYADRLNEAGFTTSTGKRWSKATAWRLVKRMEALMASKV